MKATRTWVVVADGAKARFLRNDGPGKGLAAAGIAPREAKPPPTRALGSDRPGRVHDRMGRTRHAMEPPADWHRFEKAAFARGVAATVNHACQAGRFDRLVLVAPSKTLGALRAALGKSATQRITVELPKDLTGLDDREIAAHLDGILRI